jgi:arginine/lysine/ornithine decarboxylase
MFVYRMLYDNLVVVLDSAGGCESHTHTLSHTHTYSQGRSFRAEQVHWSLVCVR